MKPKIYPALEEAVEIGVNWAWLHAHKYADKPTEYELKEAMVCDVMNSICERFDLEDQPLTEDKHEHEHTYEKTVFSLHRFRFGITCHGSFRAGHGPRPPAEDR